MASGTTTMNVRHKVGLLGKLTIHTAKLASRIGLSLPLPLIVWAIERSSYVSVNRGPWRKVRLGLTPEGCQ